MTYLVGMDEAGYGPNLGPLTVSASVWHVPEASTCVDLYDRLAAVVAPRPNARGDFVAVADSKALYKPGGGLGQLERGLLAFLAVLDERPVCWQEIWNALGADSQQERLRLPWYAHFDTRIPLATEVDDLEQATRALQHGLAAADVRLQTVRSQVVFPERFNDLVDRHGTKGAALSRLTLELLGEVLAPLAEEPVFVICDKHGGRNRYRTLLQEAFPDRLVEVFAESRAESVYRWGPPTARAEVRFRAKGENFLPAALASMACKYLRELCMRAFNDYWCRQVADLRPTAGYPLDAKRFKAEITAAQTRLGIEDRVLWRCR